MKKEAIEFIGILVLIILVSVFSIFAGKCKIENNILKNEIKQLKIQLEYEKNSTID